MILGAIANIVKEITVIQLKFFDDETENIVKTINLKVAGVYDVTYEVNDSIHQSIIKILSMEESDVEGTDISKRFVREYCGMNNSIYIENKSDFMNSKPINNIKIIADISENFSGEYEVIPLNCIRDCSCVI